MEGETQPISFPDFLSHLRIGFPRCVDFRSLVPWRNSSEAICSCASELPWQTETWDAHQSSKGKCSFILGETHAHMPLNMAAAAPGRYTFRSCRCSNDSGIISDLDQIQVCSSQSYEQGRSWRGCGGASVLGQECICARGKPPSHPKGCRYNTLSTSIPS